MTAEVFLVLYSSGSLDPLVFNLLGRKNWRALFRAKLFFFYCDLFQSLGHRHIITEAPPEFGGIPLADAEKSLGVKTRQF